MNPSRINRGLRVTLTALGLALTSLPGAADTFACPAAFPGQSLKPAPTGNGWTTGVGDAAPLYSAEVFDGPPEQRASLQPGASTTSSSTWTLEASYPQGIWLQCTYAGGALTLTRKVPTVPSVCVASYPKLSKGKPVSVAFDCR